MGILSPKNITAHIFGLCYLQQLPSSPNLANLIALNISLMYVLNFLR
jgi:hypothetical protein